MSPAVEGIRTSPGLGADAVSRMDCDVLDVPWVRDKVTRLSVAEKRYSPAGAVSVSVKLTEMRDAPATAKEDPTPVLTVEFACRVGWSAVTSPSASRNSPLTGIEKSPCKSRRSFIVVRSAVALMPSLRSEIC